ncbi:MAG: hypothetical protein ACXWT5_13695 [Methylophilus sp.]
MAIRCVRTNNEFGAKGLVEIKMPKLITFIFLIFFSTHSYAGSLFECKTLVRETNKNMPMQVNKITKIKSVGCFDGKPPTIQYLNQVDVDASKNLITTVKSSRLNQLNFWCTSPDQRAVMNRYNIEYKYTDKSGRYIASNRFNKNQCNELRPILKKK